MLLQYYYNRGTDKSVFQLLSPIGIEIPRLSHFLNISGLEVIKLEYSLKLIIKCNDRLLADVSASSQSLRFILSLRMNSSFITSRPETKQTQLCQITSMLVIDVHEC